MAASVKYRGGYTDGGAGNPYGTINISNHANAAAGDIAIIAIYSRSSTKDFGTVSGPTIIGSLASNVTGGKIGVYYKVLTKTDIANGYLGSWSPVTSANATSGVSVAGFYCVSISAPIHYSATPVQGTAADPNPPSCSSGAGDCMVAIFGTMDQNDGVTDPANFTLTTAANWSSTAGTDGSSGMAYDLDGGTGSSVDPAVFTTTTDAAWYATTLALLAGPQQTYTDASSASLTAANAALTKVVANKSLVTVASTAQANADNAFLKHEKQAITTASTASLTAENALLSKTGGAAHKQLETTSSSAHADSTDVVSRLYLRLSSSISASLTAANALLSVSGAAVPKQLATTASDASLTAGNALLKNRHKAITVASTATLTAENALATNRHQTKTTASSATLAASDARLWVRDLKTVASTAVLSADNAILS